MFDEQGQPQLTSARVTLAIVFIILAVIIGVWLLNMVKLTVVDGQKPVMLQIIAPDDTKPFEINTPQGKFELPKPAFTAMAYFILYIFLIIPMTIALALLKGGIALLNPDSTKRMRDFIDTIKKNMAPPKQ
jgi:hypothetical protein